MPFLAPPPLSPSHRRGISLTPAPSLDRKLKTATSYHLGQLKAKLAKLKRELLTPTTGGGGGGGVGFDVARTGIASVGFM